MTVESAITLDTVYGLHRENGAALVSDWSQLLHQTLRPAWRTNDWSQLLHQTLRPAWRTNDWSQLLHQTLRPAWRTNDWNQLLHQTLRPAWRTNDWNQLLQADCSLVSAVTTNAPTSMIVVYALHAMLSVVTAVTMATVTAGEAAASSIHLCCTWL